MEQANQSKKKMGMITIIVIVIALIATGAAVYLFLNQSKAAPEVVEEPVKPPVFLELKPFTVSLPSVKNGMNTNQVLYVGMILRVEDDEDKETLSSYLPEVRSEILLLLTSQNIAEMKTEDGKLKLKDKMKQLLSRQYNKKQSVEVSDVLFTDFIIR